jgi:hypothetical protein
MTRLISRPKLIHIEAIKRIMNYCAGYKDMGRILTSNGEWNGNIKGESVEILVIWDSDNPKVIEFRRSVLS